MSFYYFCGVKGCCVLVLFFDGEDMVSSLFYCEVFEYVKCFGVVIYSIGLNIGWLQVGVCGKLQEFLKEIGGCFYFINNVDEFCSVYGQIEKELCS